MHDALQYFQGKATQLFWYSLVDNAADQKSFGLIGNETPRPAYYVLQKQLTGKISSLFLNGLAVARGLL
jgi:hypothetical protein